MRIKLVLAAIKRCTALLAQVCAFSREIHITAAPRPFGAFLDNDRFFVVGELVVLIFFGMSSSTNQHCENEKHNHYILRLEKDSLGK